MRVVTSTDPGVGKSLVVQRLVEYVANLPNNLLITERMTEQNQEPRPLCVTIPLHDRLAGVADIVGFFLPHAIHSNVPLSRIFHLDSSCTVRVSKLRVKDYVFLKHAFTGCQSSLLHDRVIYSLAD